MSFIVYYLQSIFKRNQFLSQQESQANFYGKVTLQVIIAASFLILSLANLFSKSYVMLACTLFCGIANGAFVVVALKTKNVKFCTYACVILCAIVFSLFVIYGGNDGFASLWIALLPIFSMAIMDLTIGFTISLSLQIFLFLVFWTPLRNNLFYQYSEQFCLRFPLFFFLKYTKVAIEMCINRGFIACIAPHITLNVLKFSKSSANFHRIF